MGLWEIVLIILVNSWYCNLRISNHSKLQWPTFNWLLLIMQELQFTGWITVKISVQCFSNHIKTLRFYLGFTEQDFLGWTMMIEFMIPCLCFRLGSCVKTDTLSANMAIRWCRKIGTITELSSLDRDGNVPPACAHLWHCLSQGTENGPRDIPLTEDYKLFDMGMAKVVSFFLCSISLAHKSECLVRIKVEQWKISIVFSSSLMWILWFRRITPLLALVCHKRWLFGPYHLMGVVSLTIVSPINLVDAKAPYSLLWDLMEYKLPSQYF